MSSWSSLRAKIAYGLRTQGLGYLWRAPANELQNPRFKSTERLRHAIVAASDMLRRRPRQVPSIAGDALVFAYDFSAAPVTFDFVSYLCAAEIERRRRGLGRIFVVFIPGDHHGLRRELPEYEAAIDPAHRHGRIRNLLLPVLSLLPSVQGHCVCATDADAAAVLPADPARLYPADYRLHLPRHPAKSDIYVHARRGTPIWPLLTATEHARRAVASYLAGVAGSRRPVVITLRDNPTSPSRNSRMESWAAFAAGLDRAVFAPIFVYDAEAPFDRRSPAFAGETFCEAATWNIEMRMALYEAAWLNVSIMQGAMELCWYNERVRYLVFLEVGLSATSRETSIADGGHRIGADLDFARPFQHIVWEGDSLDAIRREFAAMAGRIEAAEAGAQSLAPGPGMEI